MTTYRPLWGGWINSPGAVRRLPAGLCVAGRVRQLLYRFRTPVTARVQSHVASYSPIVTYSPCSSCGSCSSCSPCECACTVRAVSPCTSCGSCSSCVLRKFQLCVRALRRRTKQRRQAPTCSAPKPPTQQTYAKDKPATEHDNSEARNQNTIELDAFAGVARPAIGRRRADLCFAASRVGGPARASRFARGGRWRLAGVEGLTHTHLEFWRPARPRPTVAAGCLLSFRRRACRS